jgi:holo-[acyl-carrier protein] synthase
MASVQPATGQPCHGGDRLGGRAAAAYDPAGHEASSTSTLTDDHPWAQAFVVIEARAPGALARS